MHLRLFRRRRTKNNKSSESAVVVFFVQSSSNTKYRRNTSVHQYAEAASSSDPLAVNPEAVGPYKNKYIYTYIRIDKWK